jgi:basic membrane lipoprotein Med (substrate-binding protein (PBP1-ABC) superfamily)
MREYCERWYNIITGDAFGNEEVVHRVAKDYPKVKFVFGSGLGQLSQISQFLIIGYMNLPILVV